MAISCSKGIFLTQRLNLYFLHWQVDSLLWGHLGSSHILCLLETMKGPLGAYLFSLFLIVVTVMMKTKHLRHIDHVSVLPGKFHKQRSLVCYSPWGHKESDMTEWLNTHTEFINQIIFRQPARWWRSDLRQCFCKSWGFVLGKSSLQTLICEHLNR